MTINTAGYTLGSNRPLTNARILWNMMQGTATGDGTNPDRAANDYTAQRWTLGAGANDWVLTGPVAGYEANGVDPEFVGDFTGGVYRVDSAASTFADAFTFARTGTATFVDASGILQTAADGVARTGHHIWNGSEWTGPFLRLESEARTQLLHTTNALVTQSTTVTAAPHTLHFTGTGTITLSGASTAGPLVGTGTGENNRVSLTFTPSAASLTLTVTGTVTNAQLEVGEAPSSYIPNTAGSGTVTRNAETLTIAAADAPWSEPVVIGPELVTNGDFSSGTSGWLAGANTTLSVVGGALRIQAVANGSASASQTLTGLTVGAVYKVSFDCVAETQTTGSPNYSAFGEGAVPVTAGVSYEAIIVADNTSESITFSLGGAALSGEYLEVDNISVREINPLAVSIQMEGTVTFADDGRTTDFVDWRLDSSNRLGQSMISSGGVSFFQVAAGVVDTSNSTGDYSPGVNVPFNIASRHGTTFINGAVDGTALTANLTPTALPDLSASNISVGFDFMGSIGRIVIWADDIGDAGIVEASDPAAAAVDVDTAFIAAHNLSGRTVTISTSPDLFTAYTTRATVTPTDNTTIAALFNDGSGNPIPTRRLKVSVDEGTGNAVGIIRAGEALQMERPFYAGHTPATKARVTEGQQSFSETGQWQGRTVKRVALTPEYNWQHLSKPWYDANFEPFAQTIPAKPFGIAGNPSAMPDDVAWAWTDQDARPSTMGLVDLMQVSLSVTGLR